MNTRTISSYIINKALEYGASSAGIANIRDLKQMPSFLMMPKRPHIDRVGAVKNETGLPEGVVAWPDGMRSVLVITYYHPEADKYMDCWLDWKNPPGNAELEKINKKVSAWLDENIPEVKSIPMGYYVERGGIWLKDAAVQAGLGVIGKNNILVTPQFGPRVRLRAMDLSTNLPSTGPVAWDPCEGCAELCRRSCPQHAFDEKIYEASEYDGLEMLPGRTGCYNLKQCDIQMAIDEENEETGDIPIPGHGIAHSVLTYCRKCELSCPVGENAL
ncbi:MAG: hypothetical protein LIO86_07510 [Lachnospiraceae bacterium]|nr:hypothetical protein [Lachnospiraceae bacterium]